MANTTFTGNVRANGNGNRANYAGSMQMVAQFHACLLYTSPSPRDRTRSRMPSSA